MIRRLFIIVAVMTLTVPYMQAQRKGAPLASERGEKLLRIDGMMIDAKTQQSIGNDDEALKRYRAIVKEQPDYAAAYYEIGALMLEAGDNDEALAMTLRAAELDKSNEWYQLQLIDIYEAMDNYGEICRLLEKLVERHPDKLDYYYQLAAAYQAAGEGERAIKTLDRIERRYGVSEKVSLLKRDIWESIGRGDKAVAEIERLAQAMPNDTRYSAMMAEAYMKQKDYRRAKSYYDQILRANPNDEYIHYSLANYYLLTGDEASATAEIEKGLQQRGLSCTERLHVLSSFFSGRELAGARTEEALRLTRMVADDCPDDAEVAGLYGTLLMYGEHYDEAAEQLKRYIALDSSRYGAWESLLICLDASDHHRHETSTYARRASRLFPLHLLPHYLLGVEALMGDDYTTARKELQRCEQIGFANGYLERETYAMLGDAYYHTGDYERAWRSFEKSLAIDSTDLSTLNNYAYFLAQRKEHLERAHQMSHRTIMAEPDNATYLDTYAWVLHQMGRSREALPYIEKAVKLDPDNDTLRQHLLTIRKHCEL